MTREQAPTPSELWHRADTEFPGDDLSRRVRYFELMLEQGYIVDRPRWPDCEHVECGFPCGRVSGSPTPTED